MPVNLTLLAAHSAFAPLVALDAARPDGLTKEVLVRGVTIGLLKGLADGFDYLCETYDLLAAAVTEAKAAGIGTVNALVDRLVFIDAVSIGPDASETDAVAAVAGMVADVCAGKLLAVDVPPPVTAPAAGGGAAIQSSQGPDEVSTLYLGAPEFGTFRHVWTRTLAMVKSEAYAKYRMLKQPGTPAAKRAAYGYVFKLLRQMIDDAEKKSHD